LRLNPGWVNRRHASLKTNAPLAELVRLSKTSIADELRIERRHRLLGWNNHTDVANPLHDFNWTCNQYEGFRAELSLAYLQSRYVVGDISNDQTRSYKKGLREMRIIASLMFAVLLSASTVPALADQFEWGPLTTRPRNDQNTIWDAHCNDSSEHVVSGQCTITSGSGTLQNVGVNDERDTWTCEWGQTVKASARALCAK
jgi:hypothetical protein